MPRCFNVTSYFFLAALLCGGLASSSTASQQKKTVSHSLAKEPQKVSPPDLLSSTPASSSFQIAHLPNVSAKHALLLDFDSGAVLYEKNADHLMIPSSMTKIATACFIASKIRSGEIDMDTIFTVSKRAYRKEGTSMFLRLGQKVSVGDLLEGLIVVSANDAAVALAEGLCGSEEAFAAELTSFVKSLGALSTRFTNASGLPDPLHRTTCRDLAIMARYAIQHVPELFHLYSRTDMSFNNVTQNNKNVLLRKHVGCDGLKTGHTDAGGFGIVATCLQDDQRLILVLNGCPSEAKRAEEALTLLTWGRRTFINHHLYKAGDLVAQIPVWYGEESYLPVTTERDITVTLLRSAPYDVKIVLRYDTPQSAPIKKGSRIGDILMTSSTRNPTTETLIASVSVSEAGFFKKIKDSVLYLLWGIKKPEILDITHEAESKKPFPQGTKKPQDSNTN